MSGDSSRRSRALKRGRAVGMVGYALFMASVAGLWGVQVMNQVWFPADAPPPTCQEGIDLLRKAVAEASARGRKQASETEALRTFRVRIERAWRVRPGLDELCASIPGGPEALEAIDRLRYDEEASLRLSDGSTARQNSLLERVFPGK